jgi:hypothetical protein
MVPCLEIRANDVNICYDGSHGLRVGGTPMSKLQQNWGIIRRTTNTIALKYLAFCWWNIVEYQCRAQGTGGRNLYIKAY